MRSLIATSISLSLLIGTMPLHAAQADDSNLIPSFEEALDHKGITPASQNNSNLFQGFRPIDTGLTPEEIAAAEEAKRKAAEAEVERKRKASLKRFGKFRNRSQERRQEEDREDRRQRLQDQLKVDAENAKKRRLSKREQRLLERQQKLQEQRLKQKNPGAIINNSNVIRGRVLENGSEPVEKLPEKKTLKITPVINTDANAVPTPTPKPILPEDIPITPTIPEDIPIAPVPSTVETIKPSAPVPQTQTKIDGVFNGAGSLIGSYGGALTALEAQGIWFERVAGSSSGSITAALIAAGFSASEIEWQLNPSNRRRLNFGQLHKYLRREGSNMDPKLSRLHQLLTQTKLGETKIKVPTPELKEHIDAMVNQVVRASANNYFGQFLTLGRGGIRALLEEAFQSYPDTYEINLGEALADEGMRVQFADQILAALMNDEKTGIEFTQYFNLISEGGLYHGRSFLTALRRVLESKVEGSGDGGQVLFRDLPIDLTLIGSDLNRDSLVIFSRDNSPKKEVAKAIREVMTIPFLFTYETKGQDRIIDVKVSEGWPNWIFGPRGAQLGTNRNEGDQQRPKMAFILQGQRPCPTNYKCSTPPPADPLALFGDSQEAKFVQQQLLPLLNRLMFHSSVEEELALNELKKNSPELQVVKIPLGGFSWLDTNKGRDIKRYRELLYRGWKSTHETLTSQQLIPVPKGDVANPYR